MKLIKLGLSLGAMMCLALVVIIKSKLAMVGLLVFAAIELAILLTDRRK